MYEIHLSMRMGWLCFSSPPSPSRAVETGSGLWESEHEDGEEIIFNLPVETLVPGKLGSEWTLWN